MGIFGGDTMTATASEGSGGGGGGSNVFSRAISGFFKSNPELLRAQTSSGTSEESPGNAINKRAGGKISASKRADGIAQRGKTRGKMY